MRHVYITPADSNPDDYLAAAEAAGCPEITTGTPQALIAQLPERWAVPGAYLVDPVISLTSDESVIKPDGVSSAQIMYMNEGASASVPRPVPEQVVFQVNGSPAVAIVTGGVATIEVASQSPGDTVVITCEGLTTTVQVLEA